MIQSSRVTKDQLFFISCVFIIVICVVSLYVRNPLLTETNPIYEQPWDHHYYIEMASSPFSNTTAPYCYRIIVPLIAYVLPMPLELGFLLITLVSLSTAGIFLYLFLRKIGIQYEICVASIFLFFSLQWASSFNIWDFWLVDSTCFVFILLALLLILHEKPISFLVIISIGLFVKEPVALCLIPYLMYNRGRDGFGLRFLECCLCISPYLIFRIFYPATSGTISPIETVLSVLIFRSGLSVPSIIISLTVGTWSLIVLLFVGIYFISTRDKLGFFLPFLCGVYCQLVLAVNTERLLILGFPMVLAMCSRGMETVVKK